MSLLGLDIGTSGCKAAVFGTGGERLSLAYREYAIQHPQPGWAELDSREVWEKSRAVIREAVASAGNDPVTALSVSSLGEAAVPVTREREILGSSILSLDGRGGEYAARFPDAMSPEAFHQINPNFPGPAYTMPKLCWLSDNEPELFAKADYFLLWADCALFLLGGEPVTNHALANRTLLFDIHKQDWSDELLRIADLPREKLAPCVSPGTVVGEIDAAMAEALGLRTGVTLVAGGHDQCPNALGAGCYRAGMAVCGMGTFECITPVFDAIPAPSETLPYGLCVEHHILPGLFVSFLFNQAGSLVKWFRDTFARHDAEAVGAQHVYARLNEELPPEPTRLLTLPTFEPLFFPEYVGETSGAILGLTPQTTRGEILKSIMESETFYFLESLDAMRRFGVESSEFVAVGGGSKSDAWLQVKADILNVPFVRLENEEAGLAGAAMLAGLATGVYADIAEAVPQFVRRGREFAPDLARHECYRELYESYRGLFATLRETLAKLGARGGRA